MKNKMDARVREDVAWTKKFQNTKGFVNFFSNLQKALDLNYPHVKFQKLLTKKDTTVVKKRIFRRKKKRE